MAKTLLNLGEAAIESLAVSERKRKLREKLRKKEKLLTDESNMIRNRFNSARVNAVMDVATKVFGALGIKIHSSLEKACSDPENVKLLNETNDFSVLFKESKELLEEVADFISAREDIRKQIVEFVERTREARAQR